MYLITTVSHLGYSRLNLKDLCARKYDQSRPYMRDYLALDVSVKLKLWKRVSLISDSSIVL